MRLFAKIVCITALTIRSFHSVFAVTLNTPCDFLSISSACALAKEGDVVLIQPGSCIISNTLNLNRRISFTIRGSGTNLTTLISPTLSRVFYINSNSTKVLTISDLNCIGNSANGFGFFSVEYTTGPVHFYNIKMTNILARGINWGTGGTFGLIDHCAFFSSSGNPQSISFGGNDYRSWTSPNPLGTTNACYVEDCYFENTSGQGNGYFDAYDGAQLVFRHNFCNGYAPSGVHGYDSQPTSCRTWEIYNNIFTNYRANSLVIELRGGTGVVFNNECTGAAAFCQLAYYRSCASAHSTTIASRGEPGKPVFLNFASNPTNGQVTKVLTGTEYDWVSVYAKNANFTGPNGYGGGNVVIGATLAESMSNLFNAINRGPGSGVIYAPSANIDTGTGFGHDFLAVGLTATNIILKNALDGNADAYGYPAAFAHGIINSYPLKSYPFTNNVVIVPAYAWGNTLNGLSQDFTLKDDSDICGHNITNIIKLNRDYFNSVPMPGYKPLVYPHPLSIAAGNNSNTSVSPPSNLRPLSAN